MRGTLLNTATVTVGALVGLAIGSRLTPEVQTTVMSGLGLVTMGLGLRMFLQSRSVVIVAGAIALGGVIGLALGLQGGLTAFADWAKTQFGGANPGRFTEAVVTTSLLFCVGPMTLLGCIQDGLEGKTELLVIKSTLDGVGAVFFAATLGPGVLVTAGVVLIVQGALTLGARGLQTLAKDDEMMAEISAVGGPMMIAIGLMLLEIRSLPVTNYLPALLLAPAFVWAGRRWKRGKMAV